MIVTPEQNHRIMYLSALEKLLEKYNPKSEIDVRYCRRLFEQVKNQKFVLPFLLYEENKIKEIIQDRVLYEKLINKVFEHLYEINNGNFGEFNGILTDMINKAKKEIKENTINTFIQLEQLIVYLIAHSTYHKSYGNLKNHRKEREHENDIRAEAQSVAIKVLDSILQEIPHLKEKPWLPIYTIRYNKKFSNFELAEVYNLNIVFSFKRTKDGKHATPINREPYLIKIEKEISVKYVMLLLPSNVPFNIYKMLPSQLSRIKEIIKKDPYLIRYTKRRLERKLKRRGLDSKQLILIRSLQF